MKLIAFLTSIFLITFSSAAFARAVSYPGGITVMQHNDYIANSGYLNYTINGKDSVGVKSEYERKQNITFNAAQYTRVLKRWNQEDSQGNLYFTSGAGGADVKNKFKSGAFAAIEGDWESRRYYIAYKGSVTKLENQNTWFREMARVGVAPYLGNYDDLQTWFILQVNHTPQLKDNFVVTPMIRLFKGAYLAEFGVSSNKTVLFNIMAFF